MMRKPGSDEMWFGGVLACEVISYADLRLEPNALDRGGFWCVLAEFDGPLHAWQMAHAESSDLTHYLSLPRIESIPDDRPSELQWLSDQTDVQYQANVITTQGAITRGAINQTNICRILSSEISKSQLPEARRVLEQISLHNPAPYQGLFTIEGTADYPGAWVVSASPELSFAVEGNRITSAPIKGTAPTESELLEKDRTENVMIADVVRNDLARICVPGSVEVENLLELQQHPGLVHLVTTMGGELDWDSTSWAQIIATMHPPTSVAGAPKQAAIELIAELETSPRELYCGQLGWIDVDQRRAKLAVAIRTFVHSDGQLRYGTGAGITSDSDPLGEWNETVLKSSRLIQLISGMLQA